MSEFFEETMQGLLEACAIEMGIIPIVEKNGMPASTFVAEESPIILDEKSEEVSFEKISAVERVRKLLDMESEPLIDETEERVSAILSGEKTIGDIINEMMRKFV